MKKKSTLHWINSILSTMAGKVNPAAFFHVLNHLFHSCFFPFSVGYSEFTSVLLDPNQLFLGIGEWVLPRCGWLGNGKKLELVMPGSDESVE